MFTRILYRTRRIAVCAFMAVMPLGVELPEENPGELMIGVHGGGGQVISVVRDCDGNAISSKSHPLTEISGSAQYSRKTSDNTSIVFGIRGGQIGVRQVTYQYFNPHIGIESRLVGLGIGYFGGDVPLMFGDENDVARLSSHLRIGSSDGGYFLVSLNENQPLLTAGGPFVIGGGYAPGSRVRGFTGLSAMFYDGVGLAQQFEIELSEIFLVDLGFRIGKAHESFDGGASIGFRFRMPTK